MTAPQEVSSPIPYSGRQTNSQNIPTLNFREKSLKTTFLCENDMSEIDVVLSKINIIKNCLMAIEKAGKKEKDEDFKTSIYELNLQRAIQACIDLANIVISKEGL